MNSENEECGNLPPVRMVTLITGLKTERRMLGRTENVIKYADMKASRVVPVNYSQDDWIDAPIEIQNLPIMTVNKAVHTGALEPSGELEMKIDSTYIAYTKEVEDLLRAPFKLIAEENDTLRNSIDLHRGREADLRKTLLTYATGGFFFRLKYLFTGRV